MLPNHPPWGDLEAYQRGVSDLNQIIFCENGKKLSGGLEAN